MAALLPVVDSNPAAGLNEFLKTLLESGKIAAVLAPRRIPGGDAVVPAMISNPAGLDTDPFTPVLPVGTASVVSSLTREGPPPAPVAVLIRNCQTRALVELLKFKQAHLENVILIGLDCAGTVEATKLAAAEDGGALAMGLFRQPEAHSEHLRPSCGTCVEFAPANCDVVVGVWGRGEGEPLLAEALTEKGAALLEGLEPAGEEAAARRGEALATMRKARVAADEAFRGEHAGVQGLDALTAYFAHCINCQNCRRVCPVCYCRECFFCSESLDQSPEDWLGRARVKGASRLPADTLLFHAGRFNHMILSCVECGLCEQACPADIPLMQIIKRVAHDAREQFGYLPGRSVEEDVPLRVFEENEFHEVGES